MRKLASTVVRIKGKTRTNEESAVWIRRLEGKEKKEERLYRSAFSALLDGSDDLSTTKKVGWENVAWENVA